MGRYFRPTTLQDALTALATAPWTILAGATDFYPARGTAAADVDVLDISRLAAPITRTQDQWRLPASLTWSGLATAGLPAQFDALKHAATRIGGPQIQNVGTLIGNLCNASPAADGIPCLLALDATVELASHRGTRHLPVADFVTGPRATAIGPDELAVALLVPARDNASSVFLKLGARAHLVISIAMLAITIETTAGRITHARVAIGACGPVATRLPRLEAALLGHPPDQARVTPDLFTELAPIDDIRATATYRRHAAVELVCRGLALLA